MRRAHPLELPSARAHGLLRRDLQPCVLTFAQPAGCADEISNLGSQRPNGRNACAQIDQRRGRRDPGVRRSHPRRAKARCGRRARSPPLTCLAARRTHAHTRTPVAASRTRLLARARPPALATRRQRASSPRNCAAPNCPASPRSPPPLTCPPARRTRTPARSAPRARLLALTALAAPWPRPRVRKRASVPRVGRTHPHLLPIPCPHR